MSRKLYLNLGSFRWLKFSPKRVSNLIPFLSRIAKTEFSEVLTKLSNAFFNDIGEDNDFMLSPNPKMAGGSIWPPCDLSKNVSSKERVEPWFFVTYTNISHVFPVNFIEIYQVVQKIWRISLSILAIFIDFHRYFEFFDISLLQRN